MESVARSEIKLCSPQDCLLDAVLAVGGSGHKKAELLLFDTMRWFQIADYPDVMSLRVLILA